MHTTHTTRTTRTTRAQAKAERVLRARDLGLLDGVKSARATWASLRERDELAGNETLMRAEAAEMAAACASSAIAHGEISADDRDEYVDACTEAHLAVWPVCA